MFKKSVLLNHTEFESGVQTVLDYGLALLKEGRTKPEDANRPEKGMILEALLLRGCALWERFVEKEVVLLVSLDPRSMLSEVGLPTKFRISRSLVRAILFSDVYRDFHDVERWRSYLRRVISRQHNLFESITSEQRRRLNFVYKMRNYLSHYSSYSRRKLMDEYGENYGYRKFLEPRDFLLKERGTHFERLVHNFKLVSLTMRRPSP